MASNVLLLQGPMGPFFRRLRGDLETLGKTVYKINFNGGDRYYYRQKNTFDYQNSIANWRSYLIGFCKQYHIDTFILFGNERIYHKIAHEVATQYEIDLFAFEEGYIRPDFITFELGGVNGRSSVPKNRQQYQNQLSISSEKQTQVVPHSFGKSAKYAMKYYLYGWMHRMDFPHYQHHRSFEPVPEGLSWVRSGIRKKLYQLTEQRSYKRLRKLYKQHYFLAPLQVHNDAQIKSWSTLPSAAAFIRRVISSFSKHAAPEDALVFKHHPMDRGYSNYTGLIDKLARRYQCEDKVFYLHDQHLPTLLDEAKATVVINSTVGLSSLVHRTPVKALGQAVYDIPGLTYQGPLKDFWKDSGQVDHELFLQFRSHLLRKNQVNGNFYRKIPEFHCQSGLDIHQLRYLLDSAPSLSRFQKKDSKVSYLLEKKRSRKEKIANKQLQEKTKSAKSLDLD